MGKKKDIAWEHCTIVDGTTGKTKCNYCDKVMNGGGITRLKHHLVGGFDVEKCSKCSEEVSNLFRHMVNERHVSKYIKRRNARTTPRKRYTKAICAPLQEGLSGEAVLELQDGSALLSTPMHEDFDKESDEETPDASAIVLAEEVEGDHGHTNDIGWQHCTKVDGSPNKTQCNYCHKVMNGGGITRLKHHLVGGFDVEKCLECGEEVRDLFKYMLDEEKQSKYTKRATPRKRTSSALLTPTQEGSDVVSDIERQHARALIVADHLESGSGHKNDIGWQHCSRIDGNSNKTRCNYCDKIMNGGGITRLKRHLAGGYYDVEKCSKCGEDVSDLFKALLDGYRNSKRTKRGARKRATSALSTPIQHAKGQSVACLDSGGSQTKLVLIWTESTEVMTAAVENGWNTFIFPAQKRDLAYEWSSIATICPLFVEDGGLFDVENRRIAWFYEISSPEELNKLQVVDEEVKNIVVDLLDRQAVSSENIVAALQDTQKAVFAISNTPSEAKIFLEALDEGLGGVVLKIEDVDAVHELKGFVDKRHEMVNLLNLIKATVTRVQVLGMGDRVCMDLCSLMRPGEGILVGSHDRGLFLVPPESEEANYVASRAFRVNAGPVHAYVAIPGGKTSYLSELQEGKEVLVVHQSGQQRTALIGRVTIENRPLILVEAKSSLDNHTLYSILLDNTGTVGLVSPSQMVIPVTSLVVGDEIMLRVQGESRHTGIDIRDIIPS
ncbi:hypothetical protein IFM89_022386 [Coptis chinensis]|uniref:BED-type domain-containing protein n=1 Tax=Coptis chinensis TaxID=261450 RepID=A0A835IXQ3_9MAGN|nr:hypothetical protein IFM89_022386 [Coptis chinensis]